MNNKHQTFNTFIYCCFNRYIMNYHGIPVIVEDYEEDYYDENDPDACFDDYGSYVFDLKNNKCANIRNFFLSVRTEEAIKEIDKFADWEEIDFDCEYIVIDDIFKDVLKHYQEKIDEYEKMNPKPDKLDIPRPYGA